VGSSIRTSAHRGGFEEACLGGGKGCANAAAPPAGSSLPTSKSRTNGSPDALFLAISSSIQVDERSCCPKSRTNSSSSSGCSAATGTPNGAGTAGGGGAGEINEAPMLRARKRRRSKEYNCRALQSSSRAI
jgi:hypothetical protein